MPRRSQESQVILAVQTIRNDPAMTIRRAASIFQVGESTLRNRMNGKRARSDTPSNMSRLTLLEEKALIQYILDLDSRGFAPRLHDVEDMANVIATSRDATRVGTRWAANFVKRQPQLRTRFSRVYDYQRALCEDLEKISGWFALFVNLKAKYGI